MSEENNHILTTIKQCCKALEDKKGENIVVLDVRGKCNITDYFIIATGTSEPHLRAMSSNLFKEFSQSGIKLLSSNTNSASGWIVMDGFDFIIHLFSEEMRQFYALEQFWSDAKNVTQTDLATA